MRMRRLAIAVLTCLVVAAVGLTAADVREESSGPISPAEDLMREHGVLRRTLLAYEEMVRRTEAGGEFPWDAALRSARIIKSFIEDYHEKLEEESLFPKFTAAGPLAGLSAVLKRQHEAGRALTEDIIARCSPGRPRTPDAMQAVAGDMRLFVRQYRPHAAREDTVLFPAIRAVYPGKALNELADKFEEREQRLFGKNGFKIIVDEVAEIEQTLDIGDLSRFTARPPSGR